MLFVLTGQVQTGKTRWLEELLSDMQREGVTPCGCGGYAYACPISATQTLCVEVHPTAKGWQVMRWQAVSVGRWESDDSLNLWDGT